MVSYKSIFDIPDLTEKIFKRLQKYHKAYKF